MELRFTIKLLSIFTILLLIEQHTPTCESTNRILEFRDVKFSQSDINVTYNSSTSWDARGMKPFYRLANDILDIYIGEDAIPDGYIIPRDREIQLGPKANNGEWNDLLKHYWLILLVIAICVVIIFCMPIIGFCFCCCRCAGACGGRSQPFDKKHDTCRRVLYGLLLILSATGIIFGVVIAFVTNSYLQQGIFNATTTGREGVNDAQTFLKSTSQQVNHVLVKNYEELTAHLNYMLNETADVVVNKFENESNAISLTQLSLFAEALPTIENNLGRMKEITKSLRINASQLNDALRGVKRELLVTLTRCDVQTCRDVLDEYEIGKLDINGIDYNQLPDMQETIDSISRLISEDVGEGIEVANQNFNDKKQKLNQQIHENIPKITKTIHDAGAGIQTTADDITKALLHISDVAGNNTQKNFIDADYYLSQYYQYVYYAGIAVSSVLLLVLICIVCGLLCGICGKRPDGYGDDCCNKGAGSRFLMCGVAIIFLTISILTVYALGYFLIGLVLHRGICVPLNNPAHDEVFNYVDQLIDLNTVIYPDRMARRQRQMTNLEPFRISDVISACHENATIYNVLRLQNYYNISEILDYPEKYGIQAQFDQLLSTVELDGSILTDTTKESIEKLRDSKLNSFAAYKFTDNLNATITQYNLSSLANRLREIADKADQNPRLATVRIDLLRQANNLDEYQLRLVGPMTTETKELIALSVKLELDLKFNKPSFYAAMNDFLTEISNADAFLRENATPFVRAVAKELTASLQHEIITYLELVVATTKNDLGKCGPLSRVYKSLYVAGCNRIIDPFNTFWAGIAWCIFLFLPTIIISVKLSTLYQKSDPYPGPLVESEYLYDAYSERDNIPIAHSSKNKRRKKDRRHPSRDRRGDYYEDSGASPHHGPSTNNGPRDARYNDMAPNGNVYPSLNGLQNNNNNNNNNDDINSTFNSNNNIHTIYNPKVQTHHQQQQQQQSVPSPITYRGSNEVPRHWDGGPPRYQNPPMVPPASEYERPPPYYYPGAPDEHD